MKYYSIINTKGLGGMGAVLSNFSLTKKSVKISFKLKKSKENELLGFSYYVIGGRNETKISAEDITEVASITRNWLLLNLSMVHKMNANLMVPDTQPSANIGPIRSTAFTLHYAK